MAKARTLPAAYAEPETAPVSAANDDDHTVTLHYVEPSPMGLFINRWWRRCVFFLKFSVAAGIIGAYPVMVARSHMIDDLAVVLASSENWGVPETGVAITKIARELQGRGWAADRADWHPAARLTAMPAWQEATAEALSDQIALLAGLVTSPSGDDKDLAAAARLLQVEADTEMMPRLTAAAEALNRFDTRVAKGNVKLPPRSISLRREAELFTSWASADQTRLDAQITAGTSGEWLPARRIDITTFYGARARAHVAGEMLAALQASEPKLGQYPQVKTALSHAISAWRRVSQQSPLFVSNRDGASPLAANHLASMVYFLGEAESATRALSTALAALPEDEFESVASLPSTLSAAP